VHLSSPSGLTTAPPGAHRATIEAGNRTVIADTGPVMGCIAPVVLLPDEPADVATGDFSCGEADVHSSLRASSSPVLLARDCRRVSSCSILLDVVAMM
jgi:hypothetical protein